MTLIQRNLDYCCFSGYAVISQSLKSNLQLEVAQNKTVHFIKRWTPEQTLKNWNWFTIFKCWNQSETGSVGSSSNDLQKYPSILFNERHKQKQDHVFFSLTMKCLLLKASNQHYIIIMHNAIHDLNVLPNFIKSITGGKCSKNKYNVTEKLSVGKRKQYVPSHNNSDYSYDIHHFTTRVNYWPLNIFLKSTPIKKPIGIDLTGFTDLPFKSFNIQEVVLNFDDQHTF